MTNHQTISAVISSSASSGWPVLGPSAMPSAPKVSAGPPGAALAVGRASCDSSLSSGAGSGATPWFRQTDAVCDRWQNSTRMSG